MKELTLLFLLHNDEILLAMKKRGFGEGKWNGVGGKLDPGETVEQALVRETQEEIAVTPIKYWPAARILFHEFHNNTPSDMLVHVFLCDAWTGEPTESEEMKPQWFHKDDIPFKEMWPDDAYWLPDVLDGKLVKGSFTLNNNDEIESYDIQHVSELV